MAAVLALLAAGAEGATAQRVEPAPLVVRPLASLLLPGTGQLLGGQDRGAVYLALEVYLISRFRQLDREAGREAARFQGLAYDVARAPFSATRRDTVFEYYEQMERFVESGRYDADPGTGFEPEPDAQTYNGSVWLLARRTFWPDPSTPPPPGSEAYARAVAFYLERAVGPDYQWSWRDHSLEHEVFRESIRRSDDDFRRAQTQLGLLLANHVVSAVDALISSRLAIATGRATELHTFVGPRGAARVSLSISF